MTKEDKKYTSDFWLPVPPVREGQLAFSKHHTGLLYVRLLCTNLVCEPVLADPPSFHLISEYWSACMHGLMMTATSCFVTICNSFQGWHCGSRGTLKKSTDPKWIIINFFSKPGLGVFSLINLEPSPGKFSLFPICALSSEYNVRAYSKHLCLNTWTCKATCPKMPWADKPMVHTANSAGGHVYRTIFKISFLCFAHCGTLANLNRLQQTLWTEHCECTESGLVMKRKYGDHRNIITMSSQPVPIQVRHIYCLIRAKWTMCMPSTKELCNSECWLLLIFRRLN